MFYKAKAFTIIELLVGLLLSMILVLGMLQIFNSSKRSYRLEQSYTVLQEQSRFAYEYLARHIRMAGFRTLPNESLFTQVNDIFTASQPYLIIENGSGFNNSDTITIRYQGSGDGAGTPDGTVTDCLNQAVDANTIVTITFSINANSELQCRSQNPNATNPDNTQTILNNIENMQFSLGEDLNDDKTPNRFVAPNHPNLQINRVVAVKVGFLISSDQAVNLSNKTQTFNLLGLEITTPEDGFLRFATTNTIQLRNLVYEVL